MLKRELLVLFRFFTDKPHAKVLFNHYKLEWHARKQRLCEEVDWSGDWATPS